jgi:hypothetical protein
MKTSKIYLLFLYILLICTANICSVKPDEGKPTYLLSQEFKDYTLFVEGSKWIYQLENTTLFDTLLQTLTIINISKSNKSSYNAEQYLQHQKSSFFKDLIITMGHINPNDFNIDYTKYFHYNALTSVVISFFTSENVGEKLFKILYLDFKPTFELEGKTFENVKVFEVLDTAYEGTNLPRKTYYAKGVGLIRKELWNGQVWNLVEYSVSQ